jgi:DNA (cytosine-5)-methyltransferase 1
VTAAALDRPTSAPVAGLLTKGSLCSGYGGLDLATPGTLRFLAEVDADASAVLSREYPEVRNLGDIAAHRWSERDRVDLLTAGFPCQPVSAAGQHRGKNDRRWLWPAVLDAIAGSRPAEVFLENVQNLVSIRQGAILAEILNGLRDAGYACWWTVLGACAVGAPHHRWYLRGRRMRGRVPEAGRLHNPCGAPRSGGRALMPSPQARDFKGAAGYVNRNSYLDDLPAIVQLLPTPNARDGGARGTPTQDHALRRVANPERSINLEDAAVAFLLPELYATDTRWGKFAPAVALWEGIIGRNAPDPTELAPKGGRRLNPALSEWMMGLPAGLVTEGVARSAALRLAGNGVVPAAAAAYAQLGAAL